MMACGSKTMASPSKPKLNRTPRVMQCSCGDVRDCSDMYAVFERRLGQMFAIIKCVDCTVTDGHDMNEAISMYEVFHRVAMYGIR